MEKYLLPTESLKDFCDISYKVFYGSKADFDPSFPIYANEKSFFYNRAFFDNITLDEIPDRLKRILEDTAGFRSHLTYTVETVDETVDDFFTNDPKFSLECFQHGMILDLSKDFSEEIKKHEDEYVLKVDETDVKEWTNALVAGFGDKLPEFYLYHFLTQEKDVTIYAYYRDYKIVGTSLLYINPDNKENAGIFEVSVLPEYRRKGIAEKLMYKMINKAQKAGVTFLSLQASDTGMKVYEKIGFEKVSEIKTWLG